MKPDLEANQLRQLDRGTSSARYRPRTFSAFDADDFAFSDAPTNGSLALKYGRVVVSETANAEQLAYANAAGERLQREIEKRRQPTPAAKCNDWRDIVADFTPTPADEACYGGKWALLKAAPKPRTLTAIQYRMTAQTPDDHEAYLRGVVERCESSRKQKATLLAVA